MVAATVVAILGPESSAQENQQEIVETVIGRIESNTAQIGSLRARITTVIDRPGVAAPVKITSALPNGAQGTAWIKPQSRFLHDIQIVGNTLKRTTFGVNKSTGKIDETQPLEIVSFFAGEVTQYVPPSRAAWHRYPHMVSDRWIDPRGFGIPNSIAGYPAFLRDSKIVAVRSVGSKRGSRTEITLERRSGQRVSVLFDPSTNMLPVEVAYHFDSGDVNWGMTFTYQRIGPDAWFLRKAVQKVFRRGVTQSLSADGWTERGRHDVEIISTRDVSKDDTRLHLPAGTVVTDVIRGQRYRVPE